MWSQRGVGLVGERPDIAFGLLGLKEIRKERNELLREKNGFLKRISQSLDGGLGAGNEEDSTVRE